MNNKNMSNIITKNGKDYIQIGTYHGYKGEVHHFPNLYISKDGIVLNTTTGKTSIGVAYGGGYHHVKVQDRNGITRQALVSRLILSSWTRPTHKGVNYHVDHIDNNVSNNTLENLQYLTMAENCSKRFANTAQKPSGYLLKDNLDSTETVFPTLSKIADYLGLTAQTIRKFIENIDKLRPIKDRYTVIELYNNK